MGNPDNSPPARPKAVPAEARWDPRDPGFEWITGSLDDEGRRHGTYRSWNRDGMLHGQCGYDHGKVHGKNINFHPDGTVASEADWVNGVIMDSVFVRCETPSPEPFAQAATNVWSVRYYTRDGKTNYTIRYFLRDGAECGPDGKLLPPRPARVSADARWFPELDRWVDGEIERGTNKQVGRWRWWTASGVLRHEEMRDASGDATLVVQYEEDGTLEKRITRGASGEDRDYYFDDGQLATRRRTDAGDRETYKASWLSDGSLDEEKVRVYDGEALVSVTERGRGGLLQFEARREGPALACLLYQGDGKTPAASGLIEGVVLVGSWRIFDPAGTVCRELDMAQLSIRQDPTGEGMRRELGRAMFMADVDKLPTPAGLAGVDAEPWAETTGCYDENVEAFPRLLRGLASTDLLVRDYCLGAIASEIDHQGTTSPATARVIPYLARLLSHPAVDRPALLSMIQTAGENAPYVADVQHLDVDDPDRFAVEGTYQAVCAAWPDVFACFAKATKAERRQIFALAHLAPVARKNIIEVARTDADPTMRACAIDHLTSLPAYDLAEVVPSLGDRDPLVRAATAIAVALTRGPGAPREVVAALRESVHGWKDVEPRFRELPHVDGHMLAYLALAAGAVRSADARSLAQALCERIDEVDGRSAVTYGEGLLALALGTGERPFAKRFVEILHTLSTSKQFWVASANDEVLGKWNLPRTQTELRTFVAQLEAASDPEAVMHARFRAPSL